eukprot:UN31771
MGKSALDFGPLADLELLKELLEDTAGLLANLNEELKDSAQAIADRAERNEALRNRMETMKKEMGSEVGKVISKMMGIFGASPEDLLTEEEIQKILIETFKKFDTDGSGQLELPEFHKAWKFLELKGNDKEVDTAFKEVEP